MYPVLNAEGEVIKIVGTAIDITKQKQIELDLAENQRFLEEIINSTVCGLYLYDIKADKYIRLNQRYTDLLGYKINALNTMENELLLVHPDERAMVIEHLDNVIDQSNHELLPITYRFKHQDGHWVWCYSVDTIVKYDNHHQAEIMLGTFVDITEQTSLVQKLKESNDHLERFAFVASHDLQEPLRKIIAFSDLLAERLQPLLIDNDQAKFEFSRLQSAAKRMRKMIKDILKLSRISTTNINLKACDLNVVINEVTELLSDNIKESNATVVIEPSVGTIKADSMLMAQLFQNLISNAIKFAQPEKAPTITFSMRSNETDDQVLCQDNGIGIGQNYLTQVFEPFRRLHSKSQYEGSGIGLSICQQIMKVHNGTISCESEIGKGTQFILTLPKEGA